MSETVEASRDQGRSSSSAGVTKMPGMIGIPQSGGRGNLNNGNFIHGAAARRLLRSYFEAERTYPGLWTEEIVEKVTATCSHLIYVSANGIRLGKYPLQEAFLNRIRQIASNIKHAGIPVVVLGLGAQAPLRHSAEIFLHPELLDFLKLLSDHSTTIAVRGAYTAEVCERLGVKNVEVIGCQSMFWHLRPTFAQQLTEPKADSRPVAFNFTQALTEFRLINQAMDSGFDLIGQGFSAEEGLRLTGTSDAPYSVGTAKAFERGFIDQGRYEAWIRRHFFQFLDADSWIRHMKSYRFSYGTRFHGNMAALIAGTRALWVAHDSRLLELCEHLRLPHVMLADVQTGANVDELFERADYSDCERVYPQRYRALYEYLERAAVPHRLPAPQDAPFDTTALTAAGPTITSTSNGSARVSLDETIQKNTHTKYDRYPSIFEKASSVVRERMGGASARVLSFGCSSGEEAMALAEKYFTVDYVLGVDISTELVEQARRTNSLASRVTFEKSCAEVLSRYGPFDAIFAMSVLCAWPVTKDAPDVSKFFNFERFDCLIAELDRYLVRHGIMVIYNANFRFCDSALAKKYRAVAAPEIKDSGFVHKFDVDNRRRTDYDSYPEVIFEKIL